MLSDSKRVNSCTLLDSIFSDQFAFYRQPPEQTDTNKVRCTADAYAIPLLREVVHIKRIPL